MSGHFLDTTGLLCPLPIFKAKKALASIPEGEILEVHSTDPGSMPDFESFCRQTGNELVETSQEGDVYKFKIKRGAKR